MKSEHEKLNEVCELIGYGGEFPYDKIEGYWERVCDDSDGGAINRTVDVCEIIFTPLFTKGIYYFILNSDDIDIIYKGQNWKREIIDNLYDPVGYLHDLLGLK